MIDTNILVTFLTQPPTELEQRKFESVQRLMSTIESGTASAIVPEVVLHELFYTLLGNRFPDVTLSNLGPVVTEILGWTGWAMSREETRIYMRAIDILIEQPKLEFSDAVIAARAEAHDAELATFDRRLAEAYSGPLWAES